MGGRKAAFSQGKSPLVFLLHLKPLSVTSVEVWVEPGVGVAPKSALGLSAIEVAEAEWEWHVWEGHQGIII